MIDITRLHVGDKMHYQPAHYQPAHYQPAHYQPAHHKNEKWENGIVKEIREDVLDDVWVIYNCAGNWDRYTDYTSAKTDLRDLKLGWRY